MTELKITVKMEQIIQFLTIKQSARNKAFMFLWKVLMAILMTNHWANLHGYCFINKEIKLNDFINFILSTNFIVLISFYLFYVFLFFWAFKILGAFNSVMFDNIWGQYTNSDFSKLYKRLKIRIKKSPKGEYYVKNEHGLKILNAINDDIELGVDSAVLSILYSISNVLFSTFFVLNSYEYELITVNSYVSFYKSIYWTTLLLMVLSGLFSLYVTNIYARSDNMDKWINEIKLKGFYVDLFPNESKKTMYQIIIIWITKLKPIRKNTR